MFQRSEASDIRSILRVNHTLRDFVESLNADIEAAEKLQANAQRMRVEVYHLDGPPSEESIRLHASRLPPFIPPPPPVPFDMFAAQTTPSSAQDATPSTSQDATPSTAQDATPSTAQDAIPSTSQDATSSTAQDATPSSAQDASAAIDQRTTEVALPTVTFRQHVRSRRLRGDMLLISVKRQRKLKMKKHKYKKLMKRTRLERRKLDRT